MATNTTASSAAPASIALAPESAKLLARRLRDELAKTGNIPGQITHSSVLEMIARACGHRDWNTMSATPLPRGELSMTDLPMDIRRLVENGDVEYVRCESINPANPVLLYSYQLLRHVADIIEGDEFFNEAVTGNNAVTLRKVAEEFSKLADEDYQSSVGEFHQELMFDLWAKYGASAIDHISR